MSINAILNAFDPSNTIEIVDELVKPPKKDVTKTHFTKKNIKPNAYHSMDVLYLTHDGDYKYLLVCVDVHTRAVDVKPLTDLKSSTVLEAYLKIWNGNNDDQHYLGRPMIMHVDKGGEFAKVKKFLKDNKVAVRVSATNRHSQQAVVESMNKIIGTSITKLQLYEELRTKTEHHEWVEFLPKILKVLNSRKKKDTYREPTGLETVKCKDNECEVVPIGTLVRVAMDVVKNLSGKTIDKKRYRSGDLRWSAEPSKVVNILMYPRQPIRYVVEGYTNNTFSKNQLKPVKSRSSSEALPAITTPKVKIDDKYIVEAILGKRNTNKGIEYLVKFRDGDELWQPRKTLIQDIPLLIKAFEQTDYTMTEVSKPKLKPVAKPKPKPKPELPTVTRSGRVRKTNLKYEEETKTPEGETSVVRRSGRERKTNNKYK